MGRRKAAAALRTSLLLLLLAACDALSPPWWVAYSLFHEAMHRDPCLNVSWLEPVAAPPARAGFGLTITACKNASGDKLDGLATFLTVRLDFGGTVFLTQIKDHRGGVVRPLKTKSPAHALKLAGAALHGNPWFKRTAISAPLPCLHLYWVVCTPDVAQVWTDNLADLYGNLNLLAEGVFARVMQLQKHGLRSTTEQLRPPKPLHEQQVGSDQQQQTAALGAAAEAADFEQQEHGALLGTGIQGQRFLRRADDGARRREGPDQRLLLPATQDSSQPGLQPWAVSAKCWAIGLARRLGGEAAVHAAVPWLL